MEISKMLTLSTAHITEGTAQLLQETPDTDVLGIPVYEKSEYGWFIYLSSIPDVIFSHLPKDLQDILSLAKDVGCDVVCLDCDGPALSYLEVY